jgi:XRE family aerobic/anaerobic benzoate catabolism transcriptional regulator
MAKSTKRAAPSADGVRNGNRADSSEAYLVALGERVRNARTRHGMTRRMLAHDSRISERYLAQLESGRGNFSILLLRRLAAAIAVPVAELIDPEQALPIEHALLLERLRRLAPAELAEASSLIAKRFGRANERFERIALIGLRGAGKTTLGKLLANHLGWPFVEMSREIRADAGTTIDEIFELWGQAGYRRYERSALERVLRSYPRCVIAASGGLVSEPAAFERLLDSCYTIWLRASPREHWDRVIRQGDLRVSRGVRETQALADMRRILARRETFYRLADATVDTGRKRTDESMRDLAALVSKRITAEHRSARKQEASSRSLARIR